MEICIPIQSTKRTAKNTAMDPLMITVNNFFGHWFTDIDIRRCPGDMNILPTNNSGDIYNYSNAQMKYLPEKYVKKLLKNLLYSNKPVYLAGDTDRRLNNDDTAADRTEESLTYHIAKLKNHLLKKMFTEFPY